MRLAAIQALACIDDSRATSTVVTALGDPDGSVRNAAALAIQGLDDGRAIDALRLAGAAGDSTFRQTIIAELSRRAGEGASAALVERLSDPDKDVRMAAVRALGKRQGRNVVAALSTAFDDPEGFVRITVAQALDGRDDSHSIDTLARAIDDTDGAVRYVAGKALGKLATHLVLEPLSNGGVNARRELVKVLAAQPGRQPLEDLVALLRDDAASVATDAALALAAKDLPSDLHPGVLESVNRLLQSEDSNVRLAAAQALSATNSDSLVDALNRMLKDSNIKVRLAAVKALGRSKDSRATDALIEMVADYVARAPVSEAGINAAGLKAATRSIVAHADDDDVVVMAEAVAVLERSSDPAVATPRSQQVLQDYKTKLAERLKEQERSSSPESGRDAAMMSRPEPTMIRPVIDDLLRPDWMWRKR